MTSPDAGAPYTQEEMDDAAAGLAMLATKLRALNLGTSATILERMEATARLAFPRSGEAPRAPSEDKQRLLKLMERPRYEADNADAHVLLVARDAALSDDQGRAAALPSRDFWWLMGLADDAIEARAASVGPSAGTTPTAEEMDGEFDRLMRGGYGPLHERSLNFRDALKRLCAAAQRPVSPSEPHCQNCGEAEREHHAQGYCLKGGDGEDATSWEPETFASLRARCDRLSLALSEFMLKQPLNLENF